MSGPEPRGDDPAEPRELTHGEWNERVRGETDIQRLDRNFAELLQELRVVQTGVQILFAFLLTLAFTERFAQISGFQKALYILTLLMTTAATGLLIAPVSFHRLTFRRRMRPELVSLANRFAIGGLAFLMLSLVSALFFITDVLLDGVMPIVLTAIAAAWLVLFWYVLPGASLWRRRKNEGDSGS